jgi:AraC-like DNA-binding protein
VFFDRLVEVVHLYLKDHGFSDVSLFIPAPAVSMLLSFDRYCRAIRQAQVKFVLTKPASELWAYKCALSPQTILQFGCEGGASIADGILTDENYVLIGRRHPSESRITINGEWIQQNEWALLPPGGHFIFASDGPRSWVSVTISRAIVEEAWLSTDRLKKRLTNKKTCIVPMAVDDQQRMLRQAENLLALAGSAAEDLILQAASELVLSARQVISNDEFASRTSLENLKASEIVAAAMAALSKLELADGWYVEDLAAAASVHSRTLLRAFHRVVGMGPVRYLRLRQLNEIRRQLLEAGKQGRTVTQVLQAAGANDMGRIAGAYKALFNESPSETLRASLRVPNEHRESITLD